MPDEVIKLVAVYDGTELAGGLSGTTSQVETDTAAWREAFSGMAEQTAASNEALIASIKQLTSVITEIPVKSRIATEETSGAFALMTEHIVKSAEVAKLEAAGIGGAFSGLGAILGGGIAVGFLAHVLDETNKEVIALGNLSAQTGITISSLAGLQRTTREMGIDFQVVQQSMNRLEAAQAKAVEGSKAQVDAFKRIGLSVDDIKSLSPEELFNTVSGAVKNTSSSADIAASSMLLLGRGGRALIPVFKEYGSSLDEAMRKLGEESGVTEQAYQEALKYQKVMAALGEEVRKLAIESIPYVTTGIRYFTAILDEARGAVGEIIIRIQELVAVDTELFNALAGNQSWSDAFKGVQIQVSLATQKIQELNAETAKAVNQDLGVKQSGDLMDFVRGLDSGKNKPSGAGAPPSNRMEEWKLQIQQEQDARNDSHLVMESQELVFWDDILQTVKLKTAEEVEIRHRIATLNKEILNEMHAETVRSFEEEARAEGEGSDKQIATLRRLYDYVVGVYGTFSAEALRVYTEIENASGKAAQKQLKDLEELAKAQAKLAQQGIEERQKQLDDDQKHSVIQVETQTRKGVESAGGGKGVIGSVVELGAAQSQMQQLIALEESFKEKSISNAQEISAAKISELNKVRAAAAADAVANSQNAQADAEKIKQIDREIATTKAEEKNKEVDISRQAADKEYAYEQQYAKQVELTNNEIANKFAAITDQMIFHSKNFHDAVTKLWQTLVTGLIEKMIQMAAQWITQHLIMGAISKIFHTQDMSETIAADEAQFAATAAANDAEITSYAGVAAAAAYAAYAAIPALAAGMAAEAAATVESFTALGSAERGYDVPGGAGPYPTILHPREMVLPADLAGGVRNMVQGGNTNNQGGNSLTVGRMIFAPTVNGEFNVAEHGEEFFKFAIGKFRKLGLDV